VVIGVVVVQRHASGHVSNHGEAYTTNGFLDVPFGTQWISKTDEWMRVPRAFRVLPPSCLERESDSRYWTRPGDPAGSHR